MVCDNPHTSTKPSIGPLRARIQKGLGRHPPFRSAQRFAVRDVGLDGQDHRFCVATR